MTVNDYDIGSIAGKLVIAPRFQYKYHYDEHMIFYESACSYIRCIRYTRSGHEVVANFNSEEIHILDPRSVIDLKFKNFHYQVAKRMALLCAATK